MLRALRPEWVKFQAKPERQELGSIAGLTHQQNHHERSGNVVRMNDETCLEEMRSRLLAKPTNNFHSAILPSCIDVVFASQIVIEKDLLPVLRKPGDAVAGRLHPDRLGVSLQEKLSPTRVIIEKQNPHRRLVLRRPGAASRCCAYRLRMAGRFSLWRGAGGLDSRLIREKRFRHGASRINMREKC